MRIVYRITAFTCSPGTLFAPLKLVNQKIIAMNIYVFNLHDGVSDHELKQLFVPFGEVKSASVVMDVISGGSRGFGHVEIEDENAAQKAITHLNGTELETLTIYVEKTKTTEGIVLTGSHHFDPAGFIKN